MRNPAHLAKQPERYNQAEMYLNPFFFFSASRRFLENAGFIHIREPP
jgi:hypothetical protein